MAQDVVAEFERYMARLGEGLGYSTRNAHLTEYCGGLDAAAEAQERRAAGR